MALYWKYSEIPAFNLDSTTGILTVDTQLLEVVGNNGVILSPKPDLTNPDTAIYAELALIGIFNYAAHWIPRNSDAAIQIGGFDPQTRTRRIYETVEGVVDINGVQQPARYFDSVFRLMQPLPKMPNPNELI